MTLTNKKPQNKGSASIVLAAFASKGSYRSTKKQKFQHFTWVDVTYTKVWIKTYIHFKTSFNLLKTITIKWNCWICRGWAGRQPWEEAGPCAEIPTALPPSHSYCNLRPFNYNQLLPSKADIQISSQLFVILSDFYSQSIEENTLNYSIC